MTAVSPSMRVQMCPGLNLSSGMAAHILERKRPIAASLTALMRYLLLLAAAAACIYFGNRLWEFIQAMPGHGG